MACSKKVTLSEKRHFCFFFCCKAIIIYFFGPPCIKFFYRVIEKDALSKTNINACEYVGDECRTVIGDIKEILQ